MEKLHKYYLVSQAMPPQELADGVEVKGAGIDTEEYGKCFFVVNVGAMAADELVLESSGSCGIALLSPDAADTAIHFGSPSDSVGARIFWNYNADSSAGVLTIDTN